MGTKCINDLDLLDVTGVTGGGLRLDGPGEPYWTSITIRVLVRLS